MHNKPQLKKPEIASWEDEGGSCSPGPAPAKKRPWIAPVLTKHNLKDTTLQEGGSCIGDSGPIPCLPGP